MKPRFYRSSRCLGCKGYVHHTHAREDESIEEATYCDDCLKALHIECGDHKAWKDSSTAEKEAAA